MSNKDSQLYLGSELYIFRKNFYVKLNNLLSESNALFELHQKTVFHLPYFRI